MAGDLQHTGGRVVRFVRRHLRRPDTPPARPEPPPIPSPSPSDSPIDTAARVWSDAATRRSEDDEAAESDRRREWIYHPSIIEWIDRRAGCTFPEWVRSAIGGPGRSMASIGCGAASVEIALLADGSIDSLRLIDIAGGALDVARATAVAAGVIELTTIVEQELTASTIRDALEGVDVVFVSDALHHLTGVPEVIAAIRDGLAPGGTFVGRDYIGPDRFAFEPEVRAAANAAYQDIDPRFRGTWPDLPTPDPVEVERFDPSEAIESSRIRESLLASFPNCEIHDVGGAIAHPVWYGVDHDAMHEHPEAAAAVDRLTDRDESQTTAGEIPSYFIWFRATR